MSEGMDARKVARCKAARAKRIAAMAMLVALSACGGGGGGSEPPGPPPPPAPQASMDVSASADSAPAGSAAISLHAQVSGSNETPAWTLEGPGSLSADSGADVKYLPPDTEHLDEATKITVTATLGGSLQKTVEIALSPVDMPGHHWATSRPSSPYFTSVSEGNGRYVATTFANTLWSSTDGKTWTQSSVGDIDNQYVDAAWGDSGWVAVASNGSIATSADGLAWTAQAQKLSYVGGYELVVGNHVYVAHGNGATFVSSDGVHWSDTGQIWSNLAYGNGIFMAVENSEIPYRSADAVHWTAVTDPGHFYDLAYANGLFTANGGFYWEAQSPEGTTWISTSQTDMSGTLAGAGSTLFAFDFADMGVKLAGGVWRRVAPPVPFALLGDVAYGPAGYVGISSYGWISTSPDALTWTPRVEGSYGDVQAADDFNGSYVAATSRGWLLRSEDAKKWTASALPKTDWGESAVVHALAHGNGVQVATGCTEFLGPCTWEGAYSAGLWLRSTDGQTWTFASTQPPRETFLGVVHDGQRFVAVSAVGSVYASVDGDTWTRLAVLPGAPVLKGIAYGGGRYVVFDSRAGVYSSADGKGWTKSPIIPGTDDQGHPIERSLKSVAWDGHQFVGVGDQYLKALSKDGKAWEVISTEPMQSDDLVAVCEGQVVSAGRGVVSTSLDGRFWRSREGASGIDPLAMTCGRGRFVVVGASGGIAVSDR